MKKIFNILALLLLMFIISLSSGSQSGSAQVYQKSTWFKTITTALDTVSIQAVYNSNVTVTITNETGTATLLVYFDSLGTSTGADVNRCILIQPGKTFKTVGPIQRVYRKTVTGSAFSQVLQGDGIFAKTFNAYEGNNILDGKDFINMIPYGNPLDSTFTAKTISEILGYDRLVLQIDTSADDGVLYVTTLYTTISGVDSIICVRTAQGVYDLTFYPLSLDFSNRTGVINSGLISASATTITGQCTGLTGTAYISTLYSTNTTIGIKTFNLSGTKTGTLFSGSSASCLIDFTLFK